MDHRFLHDANGLLRYPLIGVFRHAKLSTKFSRKKKLGICPDFSYLPLKPVRDEEIEQRLAQTFGQPPRLLKSTD
jgi:hypothetical protein